MHLFSDDAFKFWIPLLSLGGKATSTKRIYTHTSTNFQLNSSICLEVATPTRCSELNLFNGFGAIVGNPLYVAQILCNMEYIL